MATYTDSSQKDNMTIVYINPKNSKMFNEIACYKLANGNPAIDVVCIFAANFVLDQRPYLKANNDPYAKESFNPNIKEILENGSVKALRDKGIKVLLTIMGGHHEGGWSNFATESAAMDFAKYLKEEVVDKYDLDGIDIDDEYSNPDLRIPTSLVTVTSLMQQLMPDKMITKALWSDLQYFGQTYQGKTLADTLTFGWEMSYGGSPQGRLPAYVDAGMAKNHLSLGFWSGEPSYDPAGDVQWLKSNGYAGVMVFDFEEQSNVDLTGELVNYRYGPGNWNKDPDCP